MEVYMSEKEQIQKIKDWWKKYGTTILICVIIFVSASFGWRYWQQHKIKQAQQASILYEQMLSADLAHKINDFQLFAKHLMQDYVRTPYASFAALLLAREDINANDLKNAQENLQWVIDHSGNKSFRQIARIRQARILLATKQPQLALDLLQKVDDESYAALISEVRGDVFMAMGDKTKALQAYQKALHVKSQQGVNTAILAMKVNLLSQ